MENDGVSYKGQGERGSLTTPARATHKASTTRAGVASGRLAPRASAHARSNVVDGSDDDGGQLSKYRAAVTISTLMHGTDGDGSDERQQSIKAEDEDTNRFDPETRVVAHGRVSSVSSYPVSESKDAHNGRDERRLPSSADERQSTAAVSSITGS